jgi:hypothetical protein
MTAKNRVIRKLADLVNKGVRHSLKVMLFPIGFGFEIREAFQGLAQCRRVFAIARFVA